MWSLFNGSLGFIGVLSKLLKLDFFDNFFRYDLKESVFFFFFFSPEPLCVSVSCITFESKS